MGFIILICLCSYIAAAFSVFCYLEVQCVVAYMVVLSAAKMLTSCLLLFVSFFCLNTILIHPRKIVMQKYKHTKNVVKLSIGMHLGSFDLLLSFGNCI